MNMNILLIYKGVYMLIYSHKKEFKEKEMFAGCVVTVVSRFDGYRLPDNAKIGLTDDAWGEIESVIYSQSIPLIDGAWEIFQILTELSPYVYEIIIDQTDGNSLRIKNDQKKMC